MLSAQRAVRIVVVLKTVCNDLDIISYLYSWLRVCKSYVLIADKAHCILLYCINGDKPLSEVCDRPGLFLFMLPTCRGTVSMFCDYHTLTAVVEL